jgi:hypothetical protein
LTISPDKPTTRSASASPPQGGDIIPESRGAIISETRGGFVGISTFGAWDAIFPDPAMTVAAIDRLVHHAIIIEMNTHSYRRKIAEARAAASKAPS